MNFGFAIRGLLLNGELAAAVLLASYRAALLDPTQFLHDRPDI